MILRQTLSQLTSIATQSLRNKPEGLSKKEIDRLQDVLMSVVEFVPSKHLVLLDELMSYEAKFIAERLKKHKIVKDPVIPNAQQLEDALRNINMGVIANKNKKSIETAYIQFLTHKVKEIILVVGDLSARVQLTK